MNFKTLSSVNPEKLAGVFVLVRIDGNVTIQNGKIVDDFRLRRSMKTLMFLRDAGAKTILVGHREAEGDKSLSMVSEYFKVAGLDIAFVPGLITEDSRGVINSVKSGSFILLENLRYNSGEESNDEDFAKLLSSFAKVYINEAFSVSHRAHASIVGVPKYLPSYAGFLFEEEVTSLSGSFKPEKPFLFVLGGAKFGTKLPLVKKFLDIADHVVIAGALANDCYKELGYEVGMSVTSTGDFSLEEIVKNPKLLLPPDTEVQNSKGEKFTRPADGVGVDEKILDAGPKTADFLAPYVKNAKSILWNGPLGNYEAGFESSTLDFARLIAATPTVKAVVGGGDTLAAIAQLKMDEQFSFVSTGGGAMLDYLAKETLPGIQALIDSKNAL